MRIEVFALCDAATGDLGKLSMLGAFDTIWTSRMPAIHPQCTIALRIRFERVEKGEHKVLVHFVNSDGKNVVPPAHGTVTVNFADERMSTVVNLIFNIQGLKLDRFGEYSIDLAIDGLQKASLPLFVKERR
ncbi:MAG: hypothetical protein J7J25_04660 [Candidatus Omnitrophica bacterium]|nr:hypothetical protein [Candidatus Omnitrophota bacterium]